MTRARRGALVLAALLTGAGCSSIFTVGESGEATDGSTSGGDVDTATPSSATLTTTTSEPTPASTSSATDTASEATMMVTLDPTSSTTESTRPVTTESTSNGTESSTTESPPLDCSELTVKECIEEDPCAWDGPVETGECGENICFEEMECDPLSVEDCMEALECAWADGDLEGCFRFECYPCSEAGMKFCEDLTHCDWNMEMEVCEPLE